MQPPLYGFPVSPGLQTQLIVLLAIKQVAFAAHEFGWQTSGVSQK
jgi:hypothetical protein